MTAIDYWKGPEGDEYATRNYPTRKDIQNREALWLDVFEAIPPRQRQQKQHINAQRVLEVGANTGANLEALTHLGRVTRLDAVEPNNNARSVCKRFADNVYSSIDDAPQRTYDVVFTCGVLIHIPPDELKAFCAKMWERAKFIVCVEYFSAEPRMVPYRGMVDKLWTRDFGSYWVDTFGLECVKYGFCWKPETGLDNVTWWVLRNPTKSLYHD